MISTRRFLPSHIKLLEKAVNVSEDIISDYFRLTTDYWLRNPYEVLTLKDSGEIYIPEGAYAHLLKYGKIVSEKDSGTDNRHLYRILIYDHRILKVTNGNKAVLWPFLVYVMMHELVHITRFAKFECMASQEDRDLEEEKVHNLTNEILGRVSIAGLGEVIDFFNGKHTQRLLV
ncbi:MAG: hypothetical protein DSZ23_03735 [Thermodesulfatator sp.]|nr:MAG: hypothetical protein DSZ23_03735 [Thermodesulfatator sp.]